VACRSDHQGESAGRPLTHSGVARGGMVNGGYRPTPKWRRLVHVPGMSRGTERKSVTDRCHRGEASTDVRWNIQKLSDGYDLRRCSQASLSLWLASLRKELDPSKPVSGVRGRSGQLRPYVRPAARRPPRAIMGVRVRVRRQSVQRAQGTRDYSALPKTALTCSPSHHAV
jgi:hypothetical protein